MLYALVFASLIALGYAQGRHGDCYIDTYEQRYDLNPLANSTVKATFNNTYYNDLYTFHVGFCSNDQACGNSMGSIAGHNDDNKCAVIATWPDESQNYIRGNTSSDATGVEFQLAGDGSFIARYYIFCDPQETIVIDNVREEPQDRFEFYFRSRYVCDAYNQNYDGIMRDLESGGESHISVEFNPTGQIYVQVDGYDYHGVLAAYYFDRERQDYIGALLDNDSRENLGDMILRPIENGEKLDGVFYDKFENIYEIRADVSTGRRRR